MSELLRQVRASNPVDEVLVETIEISHEALGQPLRFARSNIDMVVNTETETGVTFMASAVSTQLPEKGVTGNQDLVFGVSNVNNQAWPFAKQIRDYNRLLRSGTTVTSRIYAMSDLTTILESYECIGKSVNCSGKTLTVQAGYKELFNRSAFTRRYNAVDHPGLKYS